jgi:hypothetical protein
MSYQCFFFGNGIFSLLSTQKLNLAFLIYFFCPPDVRVVGSTPAAAAGSPGTPSILKKRRRAPSLSPENSGTPSAGQSSDSQQRPAKRIKFAAEVVEASNVEAVFSEDEEVQKAWP